MRMSCVRNHRKNNLRFFFLEGHTSGGWNFVLLLRNEGKFWYKAPCCCWWMGIWMVLSS